MHLKIRVKQCKKTIKKWEGRWEYYIYTIGAGGRAEETRISDPASIPEFFVILYSIPVPPPKNFPNPRTEQAGDFSFWIYSTNKSIVSHKQFMYVVGYINTE